MTQSFNRTPQARALVYDQELYRADARACGVRLNDAVAMYAKGLS